MAGPLGVTHFLIFSATKEAPYLRIARTPRGPTLTFKIESYTLAADIAKAQTRPLAHAGIYESPPLVRNRYTRVARGIRGTGWVRKHRDEVYTQFFVHGDTLKDGWYKFEVKNGKRLSRV